MCAFLMIPVNVDMQEVLLEQSPRELLALAGYGKVALQDEGTASSKLQTTVPANTYTGLSGCQASSQRLHIVSYMGSHLGKQVLSFFLSEKMKKLRWRGCVSCLRSHGLR